MSMNQHRIKIIIADDHEIVLDGYKSILNTIETMQVVAVANNGLDVLNLMQSHQADVVLLDLNMPKLDGIETAKQLKLNYPFTKIIILTMFGDAAHIKQMVDIGVDGYLLKNSDKQTLIRAIEFVHEGKSFFDADVTKMILNKFKQTIEVDDEKVILSDRELEIITLVAKGVSNNEIAERLFISPHTVKTHRKNINFKLNIHNATELINFAKQHQLIS